MVRFIFACMAVVALTMVATSAQFMIDGIRGAYQSVAARNAPAETQSDLAEVQPSGPSFAEIYANAPVPSAGDMTPDQLNSLATAAGGDDFSAPFTNAAPAALAEEAPMPAPVMMDTGAPDAPQDGTDN